MRRIIINGKFMADSVLGIGRYAREVTNALDGLLEKGDKVWLAVPNNAADIPAYRHIKVITYGKRKGILWEQTDLRRFAAFHKDAVLLNLCNTAPFFPGDSVTVIHDIMYRVNPGDYTTLRNKLSRLWHCLQYSYLCRHEKAIATVSEFSKNDIERCYPKARGKVSVTYSAWQHILRTRPSADWQERFPGLKSGEFLFTLSTISRNKNGRWIIEEAKRNPSFTFAVAGKIYENEYNELPPNVQLLGFVSDGEVCALMKNCRAFIFPSLYEGFGLPPLEAMALGARVIATNAASVPEILGNAATYIDPVRNDYDLEELLSAPAPDTSQTLSRYSWEKTAALLKMLLKTL